VQKTSSLRIKLYPIVTKVRGLQSQGAKGEAVVKPTANPWQRRSWNPPAFPACWVVAESEAQRVKNMASNRPHPLNSPWVENQEWGYFDDFYLKLV
jgi:hypothetical protein